MRTRRTAVYRFYDDSDGLLYVGITKDVRNRFGQHADGRGRSGRWFHQAHRITVEWYDTRKEALSAEAVAIRTEDPRWNVLGSSRSRYSLGPGTPRTADEQLRAWDRLYVQMDQTVRAQQYVAETEAA